ncbi:MAG: helix-turn-helix transcriptional regulator [Clostridia bacterium]|nr:helix-turn-helix transcriptional regulator [Clostridia bacterium]
MYQRVKDLREDSDKTQKEVANDLGLWLNTYRNYETGKREIPLDIAIAIAKYYHVSVDYLAGLTDDPHKLK